MHKHISTASEAVQHKTDVHTWRTPATSLHKLAQPSAAQRNQGLGVRTIIAPRRVAKDENNATATTKELLCLCCYRRTPQEAERPLNFGRQWLRCGNRTGITQTPCQCWQRSLLTETPTSSVNMDKRIWVREKPVTVHSCLA